MLSVHKRTCLIEYLTLTASHFVKMSMYAIKKMDNVLIIIIIQKNSPCLIKVSRGKIIIIFPLRCEIKPLTGLKAEN